jgi:hypothetical protein
MDLPIKQSKPTCIEKINKYDIALCHIDNLI